MDKAELLSISQGTLILSMPFLKPFLHIPHKRPVCPLIHKSFPYKKVSLFCPPIQELIIGHS